MDVEQIQMRLAQLLDLGQKVLSTRHHPPKGVIADDYVNDEPFYEWKAGALSYLKTVFGEENPHFQGFKEECKYARYTDAIQGQSILKAAKTDIDGGFLKRIENLVAADIFSDFIEMAEYLVGQGYKDPAASLIGAVLEDGLRKIISSKNIVLPGKGSINSMNQVLTESQVYNRIIQQKIRIWNEIRNSADHGHFNDYSSDLVKEMIVGVRDFLGSYL